MNKLIRILHMLNLLSHRKYVSLKTIKKVCGIPERSAYRYIDQLSEANVPVFYDKKFKSYKLNTSGFPCLSFYSTSEIALILIALENLKLMTNNEYGRDISDIIKKITSECHLSFEDLMPVTKSILKGNASCCDISENITSILIHTAITLNRKLVLTYADDKNRIKTEKVKNPSLWFNGKWHITEREYSEKVSNLSMVSRLVVE